VPSASAGAGASAAAPTRDGFDDSDGDGDADTARARVPADRLARLASDPRVATAISDPRLQRALCALDAAPDRVAALEALKRSEGKQFRDFLDDVLVALGYAERVALGDGSWGVQLADVDWR